MRYLWWKLQLIYVGSSFAEKAVSVEVKVTYLFSPLMKDEKKNPKSSSRCLASSPSHLVIVSVSQPENGAALSNSSLPKNGSLSHSRILLKGKREDEFCP